MMPIIYASCIATRGELVTFVYLRRSWSEKKLHNLVIRRDLLLIYIFECKFKNKKIKRAGTDVLAEYDIHYSNEEILNRFPNNYIKPWESFCIYLCI